MLTKNCILNNNDFFETCCRKAMREHFMQRVKQVLFNFKISDSFAVIHKLYNAKEYNTNIVLNY